MIFKHYQSKFKRIYIYYIFWYMNQKLSLLQHIRISKFISKNILKLYSVNINIRIIYIINILYYIYYKYTYYLVDTILHIQCKFEVTSVPT